MLKDEHRALGIDFDGEKFLVKNGDRIYKYPNPDDAVKYARYLADENTTGSGMSKQESKEFTAKIAQRASELSELKARASRIPITTGFTTAAGEVAEEIDIVTSECVFGINLFKDMLGGIRDVVGGEQALTRGCLRT